jgi:hypothetical protein
MIGKKKSRKQKEEIKCRNRLFLHEGDLRILIRRATFAFVRSGSAAVRLCSDTVYEHSTPLSSAFKKLTPSKRGLTVDGTNPTLAARNTACSGVCQQF